MYKKGMILFIAGMLLFPLNLFSEEIAPERIEKAVTTEQDEYGVPTGLYHLDQVLVRYKIDYEAKQQKNRTILLGSILVAGCGGLLMALGEGYELTYGGIRTGIPVPVFGGICLGGGAIGIVVSIFGIKPVKESEQAFYGYYRETYGAYLKDG